VDAIAATAAMARFYFAVDCGRRGLPLGRPLHFKSSSGGLLFGAPKQLAASHDGSSWRVPRRCLDTLTAYKALELTGCAISTGYSVVARAVANDPNIRPDLKNCTAKGNSRMLLQLQFDTTCTIPRIPLTNPDPPGVTTQQVRSGLQTLFAAAPGCSFLYNSLKSQLVSAVISISKCVAGSHPAESRLPEKVCAQRQWERVAGELTLITITGGTYGNEFCEKHRK
jgi:hypothetical protein